MPVAPANPISKALYYLGLTLADAAAFRTWVGAINQAEALAHIYEQALPDPAAGAAHTRSELEGYRPFAIIFVDAEEGFAFDRDAYGGAADFAHRGALWIMLEQTVDTQLTAAESDRDWLNALGGIINDMEELAGQAGYLDIASGTLVEYGRAPADWVAETGDFHFAMLRVEWGVSR